MIHRERLEIPIIVTIMNDTKEKDRLRKEAGDGLEKTAAKHHESIVWDSLKITRLLPDSASEGRILEAEGISTRQVLQGPKKTL